MRKRGLIICVYLLSLLIVSCSQMTGGAFGQYYYTQQSDSGKDGAIDGPTVDWGDSDSGEDSGPQLEAGQVSMFSALQKDGYVLSTAQAQVSGKLSGGDGYTHDTANYVTKKLLAKFSGANVPEMRYSGTQNWEVLAGTWEYFNGPNTNAGSNSITDMRYMRSAGINPFFSPTSSYNTAKYVVYDGETATSDSETFMKRFHFLRFTGKGGGVAALDNYLVAVDTYTNLVFSFAKPTKWGSLLGNAVPLEWGPVDLTCTGPGGKQFKFYEYDPSGYVGEDGNFYMTESYKSNLANGNYDPTFTGKSPYLGTVGAGGSVGETGYPVTGSLTVKAKYIKNISMTDAWGDAGSAEGKDKPEFIYDVRSRAYTGFDASEWNSLSSFKPNETKVLPNGARRIQVGKSQILGGTKVYNFDAIESGLTLELDSRIIEIDITGNDSITDYETPIIYLTYDRYAQKWKPSTDNATYLIIPPTYDNNFEVGLGETKDFIITFPTGSNEEIQVCYELTWNSQDSTENGKIYSAQLSNTGDGYEFSGNNGKYDITYVDLSKEASQKEQTINLELYIGNLENNSPLLISKTINNTTSGFITSVTFNDFDSGTVSASRDTLPVQITLGVNPSQNQTGTVTLNLSDDSGLDLYDTTNSPSEFVIDITRQSFVSIDDAILEIGNLKLKNINVFDVGGDQPAGGFEEPEFSWNIKSQHNTDSWQTLSDNNNNNVIKFEQTKEIDGYTTTTISSPREGEHIISVSAEIWERDNLAGNDHDIIMKHGRPLVQLKYVPFTDSWELYGQTSYAYNDDNNNTWKVKKISMSELKRGETQTVTVSLSAYIKDTIWPAGGEGGGFLGWIADVINGPTTAGWGDMELTFDVSWFKEEL